MTAEQRRQAIDFGKIRGTGMPIPQGHITASSRAHILNLYYESPIPAIVYFWRNRSKIGGTWQSRSSPSSTWQSKKNPVSSWSGRLTPPDGTVQSES